MATGTLPIEITDLTLTAHSVAEPSVGEVAWTSGATFGVNDKAVVGAPSSIVTMTIAAPGVVSWSNHGLPDGTPVRFTTTGTLPTGLTTGVFYYIVNRAAGTFQLSETPGGAPITTTGTQSGTHTATASVHRLYQSQVASNSNKPPAIDDGTNWKDIGPSNLYAMLDLYRPSVTWGASPMTFTLTPKQVIQSIFFGKLIATKITVVQKRGATVLNTWTRDLYTREVMSFTDYFFRPFRQKSVVQILDLRLYNDATIEVTLEHDSGTAGIGEVVIGNPVYLGKTQYGAKRQRRNFTKFDRNFDGTPQAPVRRRNVPYGGWQIRFKKAAAAALDQFFDDANGRVAVYSALDDDADPYFEPLLILGLATTSDLDFDQPNSGLLTLVPEEY